MAKITFDNKRTAVNPSQPQSPLETFSANDVNEIKISVNTLYDTVNELESSGVTQTQLNLKVDKDGAKVLSTNDYTTLEKNKLTGIAIAATANDTDVNLRNRSTHTGMQAISTITNLQTELDSKATQIALNLKVDKDGSKVLSDVNFSTAKDSKLSSIASGATANATDSALRDRSTHTGTQTADTITDGIVNKVFTTIEKNKLSSISSGATVNSSDSALRDRSTHTGMQAISTITNLQTELDSKATSVSITTAVANKVDKDGAKVLSTNDYTTLEKNKLSSIASGATVNSSDSALRDRSTHTGMQAISTITNLQTELDSKLSGNISATIINIGTLSDARLSSNVLLISGGNSSQYIRGDKTLAILDKSTISLGNVDNTSDVNKPVSTAQATAIALKANLASPTFTGVPVAPTAAPGTNTTQIATTAFVLANAGSGGSGSTTTNASLLTSGTLSDARLSSNVLLISGGTSSQYIRGDKTLATLDKSVIGLSNVDNTSDANKPISTATQTALNLKVNNDGSKVLSDVNFSTAKDSKLASIASGATVNSLDSALRDRTSHTGMQAISTITNLQTELDSKVALINLEEALPEMTPEQLVIQLGPALLQFLSDNGFTPSGPGLTPLSQSTVTFGTSSTTSNVVNWSSVTNATSYNLNRSSSSGMTSSVSLYTGTGLTFTDTGLTSNTTYYYRVTASASGYTSSNSTIENKTTNNEQVEEGNLVPTFLLGGGNGTVSQGTATSTVSDTRFVAANLADPSNTGISSLAIKVLEVTFDPSWTGKAFGFGLGTSNYGESFNAFQFAYYKAENNSLETKIVEGNTSSSLGYTLPDNTTSKIRVRAVQDTAFWRVFFETKTGSETTWTIRNPAGQGGQSGALTAIPITTPLYGQCYGIYPDIIFNQVKYEL